jgi:hypothetical protein
MTREFFAVDDYGQGGIWLVIHARSAAEIEAKYPELRVRHEPPEFLEPGTLERLRRERRFHIDDPPSGYLAEIVADRRQ